MKVSYSTFKKYWNLCKEFELLEEQGSHQYIIGWDECIKKLELGFERRRINRIIRNYDISQMTFNECVEWVEQCVFILNFQGQLHKIKGKESRQRTYWLLANDKNTGQENLNNIRKRAKSKNLSVKEYAQSMLDRHNMNVVTGSYHLSKKFGLSQKKSNTLLNKMVKKGIIDRKIIKKYWFMGEVNAYTFDLAKELSGNALLIPTTNCFVQVIGSIIVPCLPLV